MTGATDPHTKRRQMEEKTIKYSGLREIIEICCLIFFSFFIVNALFSARDLLQQNTQQKVSDWAIVLFQLLFSLRYVLHWLLRPLPLP